VVSHGGKTIPRWRTAAILKIDISPYLSEKSSDFDEILYTAADFELDERHVSKSEKVALDRLRVPQNVFLVSTTVGGKTGMLKEGVALEAASHSVAGGDTRRRLSRSS